MSHDEMWRNEVARREREADRLSRFIRCRLMAMELGMTVIAMDFTSGLALIRFDGETGPLLAAGKGGGDV